MMINTHEFTTQDDMLAAAASLRRTRGAPGDVARDAASIIAQVRKGGDAALLDLTEKFDGVRLDADSLEVPRSRLEESLASLAGPQREALETAAARVGAFAARSVPPDWTSEPAPGVTVGLVSRPIEPVGLYVPGGRYAYPSSVLMTGIPARAAGVSEIVFCAPPGEGGEPSPLVLAACAVVGSCRVFSVGGAQAIAAMAYGTDSVPRCRLIAGPGNAYVAAAKRLVSGDVTVDLDAGPSEVAIYADETTDASFAAADMLAQVEHDPESLAILVSESGEALGAVRAALTEAVAVEGEFDLVLCASREQSIELLNAIAPEHLELMVQGAAELLVAIKSAGAVFLGQYSAVALGDYVAGPSHVLPTGGTAARLSGLSAADFIRRMNVISYTKEGLENDAETASVLATVEGLDNHARSISLRTGKQ
ncbi:MAG TPA: histidinol dehydrogenase [Candidatus Anoxymicrobiaceae bacterium]